MAAKGQAQSGHPEKARSKHPSHCWLGPLQRPGAASGLSPGFLPPSILCDQGLAGALVPWEAKVTASPGSGQGLSAGPGWMTPADHKETPPRGKLGSPLIAPIPPQLAWVCSCSAWVAGTPQPLPQGIAWPVSSPCLSAEARATSR